MEIPIFVYKQNRDFFMRILHTADWHLGQTFYEYNRHDEHLHFLDWLCDKIEEKQINLLLISGDVYDGPNPPAEAQKLFYSFLGKATRKNPRLQTIIIAGNHDSAARLEAPNPLLEAMNVTIRGTVRKDSSGQIDTHYLTIPIYEDNKLTAYCLAVPYLRQGDYPPSETYSEGVQKLYKLLYDNIKDKGVPVIAMGHLQATGSEISENDRTERTVIGGVEGVSPEAFDQGIVYTALGHLHRSQRVSMRENIRYSGTPLPMSFAEKNNKSSVVMITMDNNEVVIEKENVPVYASLISIPSKPHTLETVLSEIEKLTDGEADNRAPYLEIKLLMDSPDTSFKYKITEALNGKYVRLARISSVMHQQGESRIKALDYEDLQKIEPLEVAMDYYRRKYGDNEMPDMMKQSLRNIIEEIG